MAKKFSIFNLKKDNNAILWIGGGVLASYFLYKWLKPNKSGGTSDESAAGYNVENLSFDKFTYTALADQIEAAIWGTSAVRRGGKMMSKLAIY